VRVRNTDAGEIVNFHCRARASMSVIKVHENVDAIERALRRAFPTVKRVISHGRAAERVAQAMSSTVMPGLDPGIHVLLSSKQRRGWPGQASGSDAVLRTAMPGHDNKSARSRFGLTFAVFLRTFGRSILR